MSKFQVILEVREGFPLSGTGFDALADALYELDASDPELDDMDLTASEVGGEFFASMTVEADGMPDALQKALATLRAAIHEAGYGTPGWEQFSMAASVASARQLVA